jgi:hypothetical protein
MFQSMIVIIFYFTSKYIKIIFFYFKIIIFNIRTSKLQKGLKI